MVDCFALLDVERRPWLNPEELKQRFIEISARLHPDKLQDNPATGEGYAEANAAYNRLKEPKERLQHLIELERGEKPRDLQQIPPGLMELFMRAGQLCREADVHIARAAGVASPLLKVELFEAGQVLVERLTAFQSEARTWQGELEARLREADRHWKQGEREELLGELEELYRLFGFSSRWNAQIQERIVRLSLL